MSVPGLRALKPKHGAALLQLSEPTRLHYHKQDATYLANNDWCEQLYTIMKLAVHVA